MLTGIYLVFGFPKKYLFKTKHTETIAHQETPTHTAKFHHHITQGKI
jgi:hypothetical protein